MANIYTIGHSTRTSEELIGLLKTFNVSHLIDVRKMPRSRTNPQFNLEVLANTLQDSHISYSHFPQLAGLRKRAKDSINTAWRNKSFQAYADYMQTDEFLQAIQTLLDVIKHEKGSVALMCAEALPWRCHRSLIADALVARGYQVEDIMSVTKANPHILRSFAKLNGEQVYYPSE
ncbi:MAG: DUF488 family protein [Oligoflexales bacterium]